MRPPIEERLVATGPMIPLLVAAVAGVVLLALVARERWLARGLARRDAARDVVREGLLRDVRPALDAFVATGTDVTSARRGLQALDDLDVCLDLMWSPRRPSQRTYSDLERVAADTCARLRREGLSVHVEAAPVAIGADPRHLERIVHNLVWEAADRAPQGTPIWVRGAAEDAGAMIAVEITENIPDHEKPCLFDRIGRDERPGGCLRLFVVALLAQANGGWVWVEDRAFGGASFRVLLPHSGATRRAPAFLRRIRLPMPRRFRLLARHAQR